MCIARRASHYYNYRILVHYVHFRGFSSLIRFAVLYDAKGVDLKVYETQRFCDLDCV